ncbi:MAG: hypothetical protein OJF61_003013 [Rhodanobacteraceae bacterium]|nr:MAG: hypothetical protein OJF61_003013 [Rhodanobacteraceae bacterium]
MPPWLDAIVLIAALPRTRRPATSVDPEAHPDIPEFRFSACDHP